VTIRESCLATVAVLRVLTAFRTKTSFIPRNCLQKMSICATKIAFLDSHAVEARCG
jgi:hypothetical protein